MFQTNSFAATLALCFSTLSSTAMAADSVLLDVLHGGEKQAKLILEKWTSLKEDDEASSVKLETILLPLATDDDRVFLIWRGVERNVPPDRAVAQLHDFAKPDFTIALSPTEFSEAQWETVEDGHVYELRTYILTDGNLEAIHHRFRDHTRKLFERHGMTNVEYYQLFQDDSTTVGETLKALSPVGQETSAAQPESKAADKTLVYFLAHTSQEAGLASFAAFRQDPDWIKARTASEERAGGSLTVVNGVKSLYLRTMK